MVSSTNSPDLFQFQLLDEAGQSVLGIDDGAVRQTLRIEIVNTSGRQLEAQRSENNSPSPQNYHFAIAFRPGTLWRHESQSISLQANSQQGWQMQQQDDTFYFLNTQPKALKANDKLTFILENIGAAPEGGSRGTRVETKYDRFQFEGSEDRISGTRLQYLNIVNQRGSKQIPLYVGFLGSNTILNDGSPNELTLTIQSLPIQTADLRFIENLANLSLSGTAKTRWKGNAVQFIQEMLPQLNRIKNDNSLPADVQSFFAKLQDVVAAIPSGQQESSFNLLQERLSNDLNRVSSETRLNIFKVLLEKLEVIPEADLRPIVLKAIELLKLSSVKDQDINLILQNLVAQSKLTIIQSKPSQTASLSFRDAQTVTTPDMMARLAISFDVAPDRSSQDGSEHWALVRKDDAKNIQVIPVQGQDSWSMAVSLDGITPQWNFVCKQALQLSDRREILRLRITNLKTTLLAGYANLYLHYENIPGYWDGYITVPIHKGAIVDREKDQIGCIGIGIDKPQAKLHIKAAGSLTGLRVDGATAIAGHLSLSNTKDQPDTVGIRVTSNSRRLEIDSDTAIAGELVVESLSIAHPNTPNQARLISAISDSQQLFVDAGVAIAGNTEVTGQLKITPPEQVISYNSEEYYDRSADLMVAEWNQWRPFVSAGTEGNNAFLKLKPMIPYDENPWTLTATYDGGPSTFYISKSFDPIMLITENGNIGIGTSNLGDSRLLVEGNTMINGTTTINGGLNVNNSGHIELGLQGQGGGRLRIGSDRNDNKVYLQAWDTSGNGSAAEFLLTGHNARNISKLTLRANKTEIAGDVVITGKLSVVGQIWSRHYGNYWQAIRNSVNNDGRSWLWEGNSSDKGSEPSDIQLKKETYPISNALSQIEQLKPVSFYWKDTNYFINKFEQELPDSSLLDAEEMESLHQQKKALKAKLEQQQFGFVAQDLEEVFPEWVSSNEDGYRQINLRMLPPFLVQAIQELKHSYDQLITENQKLQERVKKLENAD